MTTFHLAQLVINALELVVGDWGLIFGIFVTNVSLFYQCILMGKCGSLGGSGGRCLFLRSESVSNIHKIICNEDDLF
jgi:hypothetical protein